MIGGRVFITLTFPYPSTSLKEVKQELKQRPWKSTADWLAHHGLLSLPPYTVHSHLPMVS